MESIEIIPSKLSGKVKIPPSKSMAHRAIICASLSKGISTITNINFSDDMIATIEAMKSLGASIIMEENSLIINGTNTFSNNNIKIDCNESGSTLRFLVPLCLTKKTQVNFVGQGNLGKRPLTTFYNIFDEQKIKYEKEDNVLNLKIDGALKSGIFSVRGDVSSQFISGLLFTLPLLDGDSSIVITTEFESKAYVDLTISMLKKFGITIKNNNYKDFFIKGNQKYNAFNYKVEGDYSQAAFYFCANQIDNSIILEDLDETSLQGDKECINILHRLKTEKNITIDGKEVPDIIPVLCVACALTQGETKIINIGRLRIKECDRLNAIVTELNKIGANLTEMEDTIIINGVNSFTGGNVSSYGDHRIAMSLAIASSRANKNIIIDDFKCVKKSYPHFWEDFKSLGGQIK